MGARARARERNGNVDPNYEHDKKVQKEAEAQIRKQLAELGGKLFDDDDVLYQGQKLVIPEQMTIGQAIGFLNKKMEEMENETVFHRTFRYRPWDGAFCMWNVLKRTFGIVGHQETLIKTMFGTMKQPPAMITINTGVSEQVQVPWGTFALPFLPGLTFESGQAKSDFGPLFQLAATGPKKYRFEVEGIFKLIEDELANHSMYRGKAFDGQIEPEFVDLSAVKPENVVYSNEVMEQLEANVWAQLRHTDKFTELGIPLKRAVLIHGPYGTGKTLAASLTGREAVENGWTFIKARPGRDDLATVMQTARLYQPAVVFYEDVDQIASPDEGTEGISRLLDDFDGIDAKGTKILCILTTNHPERIHKGMARPGRLDAMIEINELDMEGVQKLVKTRIREQLADDIDWNEVFAASHGYKPAFVTEFADRAMRYVLVRTKGEIENVKINTHDLVSAASGLRPQFEKMEGAKDTADRAPLTEALGHVLSSALRDHKLIYDPDQEASIFDKIEG